MRSKSGLRLEENSKEVILVVCGPIGNADRLASEVGLAVARERLRRALIKVVSPMGSPNYMEVVRTVIHNNIGITMSVRFMGRTTDDLRRVVKSSINPAAFIAGNCPEYERVLIESGIKYLVVDGGD